MKTNTFKIFLMTVIGIFINATLLFAQTSNPNNLEADLSQAFMLSWQGEYAQAEQAFLEVLGSQPDHIQALVGLGYNYAWSGRYSEAENTFKRAVRIAPGLVDARKGLAYTAFWRGDTEQAEQMFRDLANNETRDPQAHAALGRVHLVKGEYRAARRQFVTALQLDPNRSEAISGLNMLRNLPGRLQFSLWAGNTAYSGDNKLGLRLFEVGYAPNKNLRFWGRYDNALSLDNLRLIQTDDDVPAYFVGGLLNWSERFTTRFEAGYRELPGNVSQTLWQLEQVVRFDNSLALKVGGYLGPREDNVTEALFYTGINFPLSGNVRLEPTYFYSNSDGANNNQHRFVLSSELRLGPQLSLIPGVMIGSAEVAAGSSETIYGGHLMLAAPISGHTGYLLLRYEDPALDDFWVIALGTKISLLKY